MLNYIHATHYQSRRQCHRNHARHKNAMSFTLSRQHQEPVTFSTFSYSISAPKATATSKIPDTVTSPFLAGGAALCRCGAAAPVPCGLK